MKKLMDILLEGWSSDSFTLREKLTYGVAVPAALLALILLGGLLEAIFCNYTIVSLTLFSSVKETVTIAKRGYKYLFFFLCLNREVTGRNILTFDYYTSQDNRPRSDAQPAFIRIN